MSLSFPDREMKDEKGNSQGGCEDERKDVQGTWHIGGSG